MRVPFANLQVAWQRIMDADPNAAFLKIPVESNKRAILYNFSAFHRRALRIASGFRNELKMAPGERVIILSHDVNESVLLLHGLWLAELVAVPFDSEWPAELLGRVAVDTKATAVIYPPATSARVAGLIDRVRSVKHWLITGQSTDNRPVHGVRRLEELVIAAGVDEKYTTSLGDRDAEALVALTHVNSEKPMQLSFSHAKLSRAAAAASTVYPVHTDGSHLTWNSMPLISFGGIVNSLIVPLYTRIPCLISSLDDLKDFWGQMASDEITHVMIDQAELRVLARRGKPRCGISKEFRIVVCSSTRLSYDLFHSFEERFGVPLYTCYANTAAGGIVTSCVRNDFEKPKGDEAPKLGNWQTHYSLPSSGRSVGGAQFEIVDSDGKRLGPETTGRIVVKSECLPELPIAVTKHGIKIDRGGYLYTGDEGFYTFDEDGRKQLLVTGKLEDVILRDGHPVMPGMVENMLYTVRGVEFACTVGFPNLHTGFEIGAFVIMHTAAEFDQAEIVSILSRKMEWSECPKVIMLGKRSELSDPPSTDEIVKLFENYYHNDFSRSR